MAKIWHEVEIDVSVTDFDTDDLINELAERKLTDNQRRKLSKLLHPDLAEVAPDIKFATEDLRSGRKRDALSVLETVLPYEWRGELTRLVDSA